MLSIEQKIVSVDDHLIEPPNLWLDRLPKQYAETAPRIIRQDDGTDWWSFAGTMQRVSRLSSVAGTPIEEWREVATSFDEMRPGCYDPVARLRDMDEDGVWAQLVFPEYSRFAGHRFLLGDDRELARLCIAAYNDFIIEEWCATAPDRFIPLALVPMWDVPAACREIERMAQRGARAIAFSENPTIMGLPSLHSGHWDPLIAAAQAADLTICMHIGSSSKQYISSADAPYSTSIALTGVNSMSALVDWVYSGIFQRFPDVRVALSEGGAGWVPWLLERMDYVWEARRFYIGLPDARPSDVFRKHCYVCMIKDEVAIENRKAIGVENMMVETDYPHADSVFPRTRTLLEKALADVPDDEVQLIVEGNARRVFRFYDEGTKS